jgi:hypothetical protein
MIRENQNLKDKVAHDLGLVAHVLGCFTLLQKFENFFPSHLLFPCHLLFLGSRQLLLLCIYLCVGFFVEHIKMLRSRLSKQLAS